MFHVEHIEGSGMIEMLMLTMTLTLCEPNQVQGQACVEVLGRGSGKKG